MPTTLTNSSPMITADLFISMQTHERKLRNLRKPTSFKAIWISDLHLGTPQCHAERLLELLQMTESESLYFIGDIADGPELSASGTGTEAIIKSSMPFSKKPVREPG